MRRPAAVALAALLLLVAGAAPASAHTALAASSPPDHAEVAETPAQVELTFTETVVDLGTAVVVTGPDGEVQAGAAQISGQTVRQVLQPGAPAGNYTVSWRVVAADGHPVSGTLTFHSAAAGPPGTSGASPGGPAPARGSPVAAVWWWLAAAAALLVVGGGLAAQRVRQRR